jgi:hypothetical protein
MQHADKEDESCAQRGIRGGGCYCAPSPSSVQFTTLEPELLNGKQMEICCPQADAATTNSTASATANIARDYKGKKSRRRIRHKRELLVSQMEEEEEEEEEKLGTFVHYLFSPLSFFPIQFLFLLSVTLSLHHHVLHDLLQRLGARCEV